MNDYILRVTFIIIYYCGGETTIGAQQSITHTVKNTLSFDNIYSRQKSAILSKIP